MSVESESVRRRNLYLFWHAKESDDMMIMMISATLHVSNNLGAGLDLARRPAEIRYLHPRSHDRIL